MFNGATPSPQETEEERSLRTRVFVQGAFHWSVSVIGFCVFFVIGCIAIPHVFTPVKVRLWQGAAWNLSLFNPLPAQDVRAPHALAANAGLPVACASHSCWAERSASRSTAKPGRCSDLDLNLYSMTSILT